MSSRNRFLFIITLAATVALGACGPATPAATEPPAATATPEPTMSPEPQVLNVMTHDSFDISEETLAAFEEVHNARVQILASGDAGVMLNQAILSKENPLADVIYGVDNTLLGQALEAGILQPYDSPMLEAIPDELAIDPQNRALPVDYGNVCLNYDKGWFAEREIEPPANLEDLTEPAYEGLSVVENPATSSPGLAFLLATIGRFGEEGDYTYLDYWSDLRENDVLVTEGWSEAYWTYFTYGSGGEGDRPIVVSYASSPPVEVQFAEEPFDEAPTAAITADETCFRQIEFVGLLQGTQQTELAQAWIDFMLSETFQEDIPLHMFVFPANENAELPEVFEEFAVVPENPVQTPYDTIQANREAWVEAWTETFLR